MNIQADIIDVILTSLGIVFIISYALEMLYGEKK
jgi:hypothetical protein